MKYAVIDVGSNSIRLFVYQAEGKAFRILFSEKSQAGLAAFIENGRLSDAGIARTAFVLDEFQQTLSGLDVDQTALFATASFRNIANTDQAVEEVFRRTGFRLHVLSGREEAILGYEGALQSVPMTEGLLLDIGGGSTEVTAFDHSGPLLARSMPVGSLNLYSRCVEKYLPAKKEQEAIERRIEKALEEICIEDFPKNSSFFGIGGTIRATLKLANVQNSLPPKNRTLTAEQLISLKKLLCKGGEAARSLLLNYCPNRLHTVTPGLLILCALMERLGGQTLTVSRYGVREGYLCRYLLGGGERPLTAPPDHAKEDA